MKKLIIFGVKFFPSRGGTSRVSENLILQLKDKYDITVYCYKHPDAASHIPGIRVVQFKQLFPGALGTFVFLIMSTIHILFSERPDLIHAHQTDSALFIPLLKLKAKVISTSHEAPYKRDKWNWLMRLYFRAVERIFIMSPNVSTCISEPLTNYYISKYRKPVVFIPNGVNEAPAPDFDGVSKFLPAGASIDKPFVLFSARRLMRTKGCHTMLEALKLIEYKGQVFIAGELEHNSEYLNELKQYNKFLNIFFLDFVNPLSTLLAFVVKSELFIFPSETEGMSIMLLEVASAGKPIIASDIPENKQVFKPDEVLYFENKNSSDLAIKIKWAIENKSETNKMSERALQKIESTYLWENIAKIYDEVYTKTIL